MNTEGYIPKEGEYINVDFIKSLPSAERKAVIIDAGNWQEYNVEKQVIAKPTITVQIKEKTYLWTLNKTSNKSVGEELGYDTDKWVGAVIKFTVIEGGLHPYLNAVVIEKPRGGGAPQ